MNLGDRIPTLELSFVKNVRLYPSSSVWPRAEFQPELIADRDDPMCHHYPFAVSSY